MEVGHNARCQLLLRIHRMFAALALDLCGQQVSEHLVVAPHQLVRDGHDFSVHLLRRLGDANRVVERFRHFLHAIEPFDERRGQHHLRGLAIGALQLATDKKIKFLVGAAQLDVGLEGDRVVSLCQRIKQLVHRDGLLFLEALMKIFALQHL